MAQDFYFNLRKTAIYQAIIWEKYFIFRFAKKFKKLFLILFIIIFTLFLYGFLTENFYQELNQKLLGFSFILFISSVIFWNFELFLELKLKKPKLKKEIDEVILNYQNYNLAEFFDFEVARGVNKALKFCRKKKWKEINSSVLFYFLLTDNLKLNFIFSRVLLDLKEIKNILKDYLKRESLKNSSREINYSLDFQNIIFESLKIAYKKQHKQIKIGDIIVALVKHNSLFKKILLDFDLKIEDIENLTSWVEYIEKKGEERKKFWEYENLIKKGTLAKEWTAGYTVTLDKFSIDWTEKIRKNLPDIIGHETELKNVERVLARLEIGNVLLVGEPGTGRKSIFQALTKKSILGQSLPEVNYKRVVELDLPGLFAQSSSIEEVATTLDKIFQEAIFAGNIILVIDEFHNYIGQITRPGVIDISGIISSYLHLPQFRIIAITTYDGLHRYIEQNSSILNLFEKVVVSEISERETLILLENLTFQLERKYKKFISYPTIREVISLTKKYLPAFPFPEKAMDILNEVVIYVSQNTKDKVIMPSHVAKVITEKTQIPVGEIESNEREILLNLENLIHERIINQEEAVKEVATALQRARVRVTVKKGPMGCFLFLGPTGVGKTETSKALAEIYFGSEEKMIRLDMSEFQSISDIPRLIGGRNEKGLLITLIRENPFSLILLDEIEKAHPNILNLFLQVLDEGYLTDGFGRKVDFKNSIIIATSNAGYQIILEAIKEKTEWLQVKEKILDYLFRDGIFRPEFINRFDAVVIFKPLSKKDLLAIVELMFQKLKKNLFEKGIDFIFDLSLKEKIVELSYNPVFGARETRRVIQDKIENILAQAILSKQLVKGNRVEINSENFELKINP